MQMKTMAIALSSLLFIGCGGEGTSNSTTTDSNVTVDTNVTVSDAIFPKGFELTSLSVPTQNALPQAAPTFKADPLPELSRIDKILNGTLPLTNVFTPNLLFATSIDAQCYGPNLLYKNNPDVNTTNSGELPSGDLGIWTLNEGNTTQACTAAQLDARMKGVKERSLAGLFLLAGSLDSMYDANLSIPSVGAGVLDLTSSMPTVPDVSFTSVSLEQNATDEYIYKIEFTYTRSAVDYDVKFQTVHKGTSTGDVYKGLMSYEIEDTMNGGNCGTGSNDITRKGSLLYERTSQDDFKVDAREADFCSHSFAGGFDVNKILNASDTYNVTTNPDGWGNNYNRFIANYKKSNKSGQYSYVWQAGPQDSHSRVLQIDLNNHTPVDGESYFGYGAQVFDTNATFGENLGLICNWAGPGAQHSPTFYGQRQFLTFNTTNKFFETPLGGSDITYAPTNSCKYDGSASFTYDRDLSGAIDSADISVVKVGAVSTELEFDLFEGNSTTPIAQKILSRGANLPVEPTW
ncbi:hypothetical protein [Sulfurimonas sp.]|uniref:hypothetical protein n=2 Tax=Sulfurimonas TaxID=202746 RepID=UPI0025F575EC|nr:hypothetical protein [Sulfurimonas sp.]